MSLQSFKLFPLGLLMQRTFQVKSLSFWSNTTSREKCYGINIIEILTLYVCQFIHVHLWSFLSHSFSNSILFFFFSLPLLLYSRFSICIPSFFMIFSFFIDFKSLRFFKISRLLGLLTIAFHKSFFHTLSRCWSTAFFTLLQLIKDYSDSKRVFLKNFIHGSSACLEKMLFIRRSLFVEGSSFTKIAFSEKFSL